MFVKESLSHHNQSGNPAVGRREGEPHPPEHPQHHRHRIEETWRAGFKARERAALELNSCLTSSASCSHEAASAASSSSSSPSPPSSSSSSASSVALGRARRAGAARAGGVGREREVRCKLPGAVRPRALWCAALRAHRAGRLRLLPRVRRAPWRALLPHRVRSARRQVRPGPLLRLLQGRGRVRGRVRSVQR